MSQSLVPVTSPPADTKFNLNLSQILNFVKQKPILIAAGTAFSTILLYSLYKRLSHQPEQNLTQKEKTKLFIKKELARLRNPTLADEGNYLSRQDFFDIIMLIQLKSKLKLQKEVPRTQRERVKFLEIALKSDRSNTYDFENYVQKTLELMQKELEYYEDVFQKILNEIGISNETWEYSKELYIAGAVTLNNTEDEQMQQAAIQEIEKRVYDMLPVPTLPKSLNREKTKQIMIDANQRALTIFRHRIRDFNINPEYEPLFIETLAFDLVFVDYGIQENIFRYATHVYDLSKDPDIREQLDDYLSS